MLTSLRVSILPLLFAGALIWLGCQWDKQQVSILQKELSVGLANEQQKQVVEEDGLAHLVQNLTGLKREYAEAKHILENPQKLQKNEPKIKKNQQENQPENNKIQENSEKQANDEEEARKKEDARPVAEGKAIQTKTQIEHPSIQANFTEQSTQLSAQACGQRETWQWIGPYTKPLPVEPQDIPDYTELLTSQGLRKQFTLAQNSLKQKLKHLYGSYYPPFFEPLGNNVTIGNHFLLKSPGQYNQEIEGKPLPPNLQSLGWNRMVRKLQIKLLQVQQGILLERMQKQTERKRYHARFLWMAGGDIWAGGFGVLNHQRYTQVMATAVQPAFRNLGIEFVARSHAMRGVSSAPETALCSPQIYGSDYDALVWDFAEIDKAKEEHWKGALFAHRAVVATSSTRRLPALIFAGQLSGKRRTQEHATLVQLEAMGLPVLERDLKAGEQLLRRYPNENTANLPPNLSTGRTLDDDKCKAKGFPGRHWNPKWQSHALKGYAYSMAVMELLSHAIDAIEKEENTVDDASKNNLEAMKKRVDEQLHKLVQAEQDDFIRFTSSPKLALTSGQLERAIKFNSAFNLTSFFHAPAMCRTPLMPSDSRICGIMTDDPVPYGYGYRKGADSRLIKRAAKSANQSYDDSNGFLVAGEDSKRGGKCKESDHAGFPEQASFKDYWHVSSRRKRTMTIPNRAEAEHYNFDARKSNGWIFMCLLKCWKKPNQPCTMENMVKNSPLKSQDTQIDATVNGVAVTGFGQFLSETGDCRALKHSEDEDPQKQFIWKPNSEGKYFITIHIQSSEWKFLPITSFVLM